LHRCFKRRHREVVKSKCRKYFKSNLEMVKNKQSNRIVALYKYGHEHSQKIIIGEVVPGYFNK